MSSLTTLFLPKIIWQETDSLVSLQRRRCVSSRSLWRRRWSKWCHSLFCSSLFYSRAYFTRGSPLDSLEHLVVSFPVRGKGKKKWDDDDSCHLQHESRQEQEVISSCFKIFQLCNFKRIPLTLVESLEVIVAEQEVLMALSLLILLFLYLPTVLALVFQWISWAEARISLKSKNFLSLNDNNEILI